MATYLIHHSTHYTYDDSVSVAHNLAHLLPRESSRHEWHESDLAIFPAPAVRADREDYYGNRITFFAIQSPHRELEVIAQGKVTILPSTLPLLGADQSWESVRDSLIQPVDDDSLAAIQYKFESPFVFITPDLEEYARQSFLPGRPIVDAALDLMRRIHTDFRYDPRSTTITTTLPEVLLCRAGVCQDFAHLMVGCFRSMGLAARYVSGYLLTIPPPGQPKLVGADASHAWASLFIPGYGWLDLDPTNNTVPSDQHITLAWARDFGDVSPLRGVLLGTGKHKIKVAVDVTPVES